MPSTAIRRRVADEVASVGTICYGTSSWSESSWVGPFYPERCKPADYLREYAKNFSTVEVDATYYAVPAPKTVDGWKAKTPEDFILAAKFPRSVVHGGDGPRPDPEVVLVPERVTADTEAFLQVMGRLGHKCGPLLLQFPWFAATVFPDQQDFLDRLDAYLETLPDDFRFAVEVRNRDWVNRALVEILHRHRAALVLVDMARMPHPADVARDVNIVTADFAYGRLIGDRKRIDAITKHFDAVVVDQSDRLSRWVPLLHHVRDRVEEVYVYANNHYAGHGPETIRQLRGMVEGSAD
jgi:uncharacterized protein YecE (DUF72 family)